MTFLYITPCLVYNEHRRNKKKLTWSFCDFFALLFVLYILTWKYRVWFVTRIRLRVYDACAHTATWISDDISKMNERFQSLINFSCSNKKSILAQDIIIFFLFLSSSEIQERILQNNVWLYMFSQMWGVVHCFFFFHFAFSTCLRRKAILFFRRCFDFFLETSQII